MGAAVVAAARLGTDSARIRRVSADSMDRRDGLGYCLGALFDTDPQQRKQWFINLGAASLTRSCCCG